MFRADIWFRPILQPKTTTELGQCEEHIAFAVEAFLILGHDIPTSYLTSCFARRPQPGDFPMA